MMRDVLLMVMPPTQLQLLVAVMDN